MNSRAQAGLEYLMTYGWALILVAAVVGFLILIVPPESTITCASSDSTKITFIGVGNFTNNPVADGKKWSGGRVKLRNATGMLIEITSLKVDGHFPAFNSIFVETEGAFESCASLPASVEASSGEEFTIGNLQVLYNPGGGSQFFDISCDKDGLGSRTFETKRGTIYLEYKDPFNETHEAAIYCDGLPAG